MLTPSTSTRGSPKRRCVQNATEYLDVAEEDINSGQACSPSATAHAATVDMSQVKSKLRKTSNINEGRTQSPSLHAQHALSAAPCPRAARDRRKSRVPRHSGDAARRTDLDVLIRSRHDRDRDLYAMARQECSKGFDIPMHAHSASECLGLARFAPDHDAWRKLHAPMQLSAASEQVTPQLQRSTSPTQHACSAGEVAFRIPFAQRSAPQPDWVHSHGAIGSASGSADDLASLKDGLSADHLPDSGLALGGSLTRMHARAVRSRRRYPGPRSPISPANSTARHPRNWSPVLPMSDDDADDFGIARHWVDDTSLLSRAQNPGRSLAMRHSISREVMAGVSLGFPASLLFDDRDFTASDYEMLCRLDCAVDCRKCATADEIREIGGTLLFEDLAAPNCAAMPRCVICLEPFGAGALIRRLPCQHFYHQPCIDQWLGTKASCPICQHWCKP